MPVGFPLLWYKFVHSANVFFHQNIHFLSVIGMEDKDLDAILIMDGEDDMGPLGIYNNSISPIHG